MTPAPRHATCWPPTAAPACRRRPCQRVLAGYLAAAPLELTADGGVLSITHFCQADTTILLLEEASRSAPIPHGCVRWA